MYINNHFRIGDQQEAIDFIKRYSFGTLVTVENGLPIATHVPFVIKQKGDQLILNSHIALANAQSKTLLAEKVLVIFTEPHAYISPIHYEKELTVPTWDYIAVHAYGRVTLIEDEQEKLAMLKEMISFYNDTAYLQQWDTLPIEFKLKMAKGITLFDIAVTDLQSQKKLSQNKTEREKENIINAFTASNDGNENAIAAYMLKQALK